MGSRRLDFYFILSVTLSIVVIVLGCYSPGNTSSKNSLPADARISISTTHAVPLYKEIHAACAVDIFYSKKNTRDILSDPYYSFVKDLNFTSLQYSGGSTADHDHVIIGDTIIYGGRGDGYNMRREDAESRGESFETLLDGIGTVTFGKDFFNEYCGLVKKLGIRGDIIANVQTGTLQELYWKIQCSNAQRVIFGMEQSLGSNTHDFPDGNSYRKKIGPWIDSVKRKFPGIITVIDAAPIYKAGRTGEWNNQIKNLAGDEARLYLWDKDLLTTGSDQSENLKAINSSFSQTIPQWLNTFQESFPGKKVAVCQWGLKPKSAIYDNMIGCLYLAKFYKFMIDYNKSHDNLIGYASFMSLKSLNRGNGELVNLYYSLKACGILFRGKKNVDDLTIQDIDGLSGVACDENGRFTLLLINESPGEVSIASLSVNNKTVEGKQYAITTITAGALDSHDVKWSTSRLSSIRLEPYSVNVVEF